jgi:sialic acid synthase SpsE
MTRLFEAKPYIIAEVGSNWQTFDHAKESISAAKAAGADAVKFQLFDYGDLYGFNPNDELDTWHPMFQIYEWMPKLKEKADACGIEFLCTAFSPELVEAVDPFVPIHKIASSDLNYPQLLKAVAKTVKPVLLSTGASNVNEIHYAYIQFMDPCEVVLMYCVSAYPARTVDLRVMNVIRDEFVDKYPQCSVRTGFSDHTTDMVWTPLSAVLAGATVIEKHFTAFPELDTPDRPHSLTAEEFKFMVENLRGVRKPVIGPTPEEKDMVLRHKRRLIATRDIAVDECLAYGENFGAYRSLEDDSRGLSPFAWESVHGKKAQKEIKRGNGISTEDLAT